MDLAGSERQAQERPTTGQRLEEASKINKSLSTLGNVIMSLADIAMGKTRHIPYRNSKLTFLLKDSLGGNAFTSMIATISSAKSSNAETLSTLHFAQRAKNVKNHLVRSEQVDTSVENLQLQVRRLKRQVTQLRGGHSSVSDLRRQLEQQLSEKCSEQKEQQDLLARIEQLSKERDLALSQAQETEAELESLRLTHAMAVSRRRRSSIGVRCDSPLHRRASGAGSPLFAPSGPTHTGTSSQAETPIARSTQGTQTNDVSAAPHTHSESATSAVYDVCANCDDLKLMCEELKAQIAKHDSSAMLPTIQMFPAQLFSIPSFMKAQETTPAVVEPQKSNNPIQSNKVS